MEASDDLGWAALMRRAAGRHGIVAYDDLVAFGFTRHQVVRWTHAGRLIPIGRGSYLVAGAPVTFEARVLGAIEVHGAQTWASHRTAAALWGIPGFPPDHRIELLRPVDGSNRRRAAVVHRSSCIPAAHTTVHRGVPLTTPARTVLDLAATTGAVRLERVVAEVVRRELCPEAALHIVLADMARRGRPGIRRLRTVLDARGVVTPTRSELEDLARAVILAAGLPDPEWQVDLADEQGWIGTVDAVYRTARIVIELDSRQWHAQPTDQAHDARRDRRCIAAGWVVIRIRWTDLTQRAESVVAQLHALLETRSRVA